MAIKHENLKKAKKTKNIGMEMMLYETIFKRASAALVLKMSSTIKLEFKNYDADSFASRLSFKNISKKCKGLPGDCLLFNHKLIPVVLSCFLFHCPYNASKNGRQHSNLESLNDFLKDSYQAV